MKKCTCPNKECEIHGTPAEDQSSEPEPKSLAQYLAEYLDYEMVKRKTIYVWSDIKKMKIILEQALDAYESTEQVKIRIERV